MKEIDAQESKKVKGDLPREDIWEKNQQTGGKQPGTLHGGRAFLVEDIAGQRSWDEHPPGICWPDCPNLSPQSISHFQARVIIAQPWLLHLRSLPLSLGQKLDENALESVC